MCDTQVMAFRATQTIQCLLPLNLHLMQSSSGNFVTKDKCHRFLHGDIGWLLNMEADVAIT